MKKSHIILRFLFIVTFFVCFTQSYAQNNGTTNTSSNVSFLFLRSHLVHLYAMPVLQSKQSVVSIM
jgi:hypothetical protein